MLGLATLAPVGNFAKLIAFWYHNALAIRKVKMIENNNNVTCHEISFTLELPWPDRRLSPNAREHWAVTSKLKKLFRGRCKAIGLVAGVQVLTGSENAVSVHLTFFPPDKRARDWDNMLAAMKSGLDGLADAMGVDDSKWKLGFEVTEPTKGGAVLVQVSGRK